jgi:methylated-DNA-[protein]-cysteine S-methyltransferase
VTAPALKAEKFRERVSDGTSLLSNEVLKKISGYPAFYQLVWRACAEIPKGETRTYGWIAERIGHPNSARAVGRALGANPCAPAIPCHRVIRSDGSWGGYSARGGIKEKRRLLEQEKIT